MFTLTTYAPGTRGYSIFLDGQLVGAMLANGTYFSECVRCHTFVVG